MLGSGEIERNLENDFAAMVAARGQHDLSWAQYFSSVDIKDLRLSNVYILYSLGEGYHKHNLSIVIDYIDFVCE